MVRDRDASLWVSACDGQGAYCQGRKRLPLEVLQDCVRKIGRGLREDVGDTITWCGRLVWLVDGTSCSMSDTPDPAPIGSGLKRKRGCLAQAQ